MALAMYAGDYEAFPHNLQPWHRALAEDYLRQKRTVSTNGFAVGRGVLHCPTVRSDRRYAWQQIDYGFNSSGAYLAGTRGYGLGGRNPYESQRELWRHTREGDLVAPSDLYAIGDAFSGGWNGPPNATHFVDFGFSPEILPLRADETTAGHVVRANYDAANKQVRPAHRFRLHVIMADNHIESRRTREWVFDWRPAARRQWNYDHEPH